MEDTRWFKNFPEKIPFHAPFKQSMRGDNSRACFPDPGAGGEAQSAQKTFQSPEAAVMPGKSLQRLQQKELLALLDRAASLSFPPRRCGRQAEHGEFVKSYGEKNRLVTGSGGKSLCISGTTTGLSQSPS